MNNIKVKGDTEFAAFARQLQNDWRVKKGYQIGSYKNIKGEIIELGNYIEKKSAFKNGYNFLSPTILEVVNRSLRNKEHGAKIEKTRLFTNLLSSQPLAFNLFAELANDTRLATRIFSDLFPDRVSEVTGIIFEHSSGRGDCKYTCDHSAFDVFVTYKSVSNRHGFTGIEVKYSENLKDAPSKHKPRYEELTMKSKLFKEESIDILKHRPVQQIWRDHLLSISHLTHENEGFAEGFFIYLFPKKNKECQLAVNKYVSLFETYDAESKKYNERQTGFYILYLDDFMLNLNQMVGKEWTRELIKRYLGPDFNS
jgi:hypothetical protein